MPTTGRGMIAYSHAYIYMSEHVQEYIQHAAKYYIKRDDDERKKKNHTHTRKRERGRDALAGRGIRNTEEGRKDDARLKRGK
jgi:hypothetical protein